MDQILDLKGQDLKTAESLASLFLFPLEKFEEWFGALFYRRVQPSEIERMNYHALKYWFTWHERMEKAELQAREKAAQK